MGVSDEKNTIVHEYRIGGLTTLLLLTLTLSVRASPFIVDAIPNEGVSGNGDQPTSEPVPIRWFVGLAAGSEPGQLAGQQQVVADFNATHPGISLTLEIVDNAIAFEELLAEIAAGNPPDVVGPVGIHGANQLREYWLDLEPLVVAEGYDLSDFDPALLALFQTEEAFTGMPFLIYPSFIYYNEDLFDQAGLAYPPHQFGQPYTDTVYGGDWTVEKLEEIGMLLTLDDSGKNAADPSFDPGNIMQFGYMTQWPVDTRGEATLFGAGSFVDENGDAQIPDHWRAAVHWYYSGMWENVFIPNDPYANSEWFGNGNVFNSGHMAMAQNHLWYTCCLGNVSNWDIAAVPSYSETMTATAKLDADTIRILNTTQHPNEAFEVLAYLTTEAVTSLVLTYGGYPARISEQPAALTNLSLTYPGVDWQVMLDSIAFLDDPNHEGYMPRYQEAHERLVEFRDLYRGTAGLNIDSRLDELRDDLQWIFNRQEVYLPVVIRDPVPIRWFVGLCGGSDPGQLAGQQQVVADFNAAHPGISLTLEVVDNAIAYETLLAEIAAGNPPDVVGPVGIYGANYFGNYWLDLEPLVVASGYDLSDFDPALLALLQTEEAFTGMPFLIFPSFIYYNEDLFDQAGLAYPPHQYGQPYTDTVYGGDWTVEKLEEIGMLLTLDDSGKNATDPIFDPGNIVQFGYMTQWPTDLRGEATLFGAGSFVDGNGDAQIPDHWRAAVQWYYSGMWENVFIPNDPYANSEWFGNGNVFNSGHMAMAQNHLWYTCCLGNVSNWDLAAVPSYSETMTATAKLDADTIRILNTTQHPNEAFEVLAYLTTEAVTSLVVTYGGYPARISEQPAALANLSLSFPGVDWQVMLDSIAYLDDPNHEGYMPNYQEAYERILEFQNLYRGTTGLDIDSRLDDLRDDLQWIFNK